ncbi:MAG: STAS domain-containing protein [Terriglobales bacterium]|jgi:anti-anti-sigma factor
MLEVHITRSEDVVVILCKGRIVRSAAAFSLRDAVTQQRDARVVLLDLSEVESVEGGGLGMLVFLQRWTRDNGIELILFGPSNPVRKSLERASSTSGFEITPVKDELSLHAG